MFDVENRMQRKILTLLAGNLEPPQPALDLDRASRRRHLDRAKRADRMEGVATIAGERHHHIAERERLGQTRSGCASTPK